MIQTILSCQDGEHSRRIPAVWQRCESDGTITQLRSSGINDRVLGIILDMVPREDVFTYMIPTEVDPRFHADEWTLPDCSWAIFRCVGPIPGEVQKTTRRIYQEWYPSTQYEHSGDPEIEVYPPGDPLAKDYSCEIWIPIRSESQRFVRSV